MAPSLSPEASTSGGMRHIAASFWLKRSMRPSRAHHQDPVGGRVERRFEQGQRPLALPLGLQLLGHVAEVGDDPAHGGLVEAVDDVHLQLAPAAVARLARQRPRTRSPGARRIVASDRPHRVRVVGVDQVEGVSTDPAPRAGSRPWR